MSEESKDTQEKSTPVPVESGPFELKTPVVVRSPNWLGDCVMTMPAVRNLKTLLGDKPLTVAAPAGLAAVWRACPFVDEVIALEKPKSLWAVSTALRPKKFGAAILLPNSLRVAVEATLAAIPQIIGYPGHARAWLLTDCIERGEFRFARQHQKFDYIDLMAALGALENDSFPELRFTREASPEKPQLSLCPGAEYGPAKRWPVEHYVSVAKAFLEQHGARVVVLGGAKDSECAAQIAALCPGVENKAGKTTLEEFMAELARSRLVVCNDSGSMHLASALSVPTVALFGSTEPRLTGPIGSRTTVLRHHVPCSPCFLRECPLDFGCMKALTPEKVLPVCLERWAA